MANNIKITIEMPDGTKDEFEGLTLFGALLKEEGYEFLTITNSGEGEFSIMFIDEMLLSLWQIMLRLSKKDLSEIHPGMNKFMNESVLYLGAILKEALDGTNPEDISSFSNS